MYVQADASQLEWRGALELSHDWVGINEIKNNQDVHSLNQLAFDLPSRLVSKVYLFRTIFRGTGWGFANDPDFMHVSTKPEYWDAINEKFYAKYFKLNEQHFIWKDLVLNGKPIVGPLGREWFIEYKGEIPWQVLTNYPVQGTCADVMALARVIFRKRLNEKSWGKLVLLITTVHDSIIVDCPNHLINDVTLLFYAVFRDLPLNIKNIFNYEWVTPLACECKIGPTMKNMQKFVPTA